MKRTNFLIKYMKEEKYKWMNKKTDVKVTLII